MIHPASPRLALALALAALALSSASPGPAGAQPAADSDDLAREGYPLDAIPRRVEPTGPMRCPEVPLQTYAGTAIPWKKALKVHPAFARRLAEFERLAVSVATRVYGRAPTNIAHLGSYKCRRIRRYPDLLSEHGLGNAIDITRFEFSALPRGATAPPGLPRALTRAFSASILDHWDSPEDGRPKSYHRRFLRELARELEARPDIFRVLLGPAYPGHKDHFHFDAAPYRLVVL